MLQGAEGVDFDIFSGLKHGSKRTLLSQFMPKSLDVQIYGFGIPGGRLRLGAGRRSQCLDRHELSSITKVGSSGTKSARPFPKTGKLYTKFDETSPNCPLSWLHRRSAPSAERINTSLTRFWSASAPLGYPLISTSSTKMLAVVPFFLLASSIAWAVPLAFVVRPSSLPTKSDSVD